MFKRFSVSALLLGAVAASAMADTSGPDDQTLINIAGHAVPVVKDGLYDRYRSNPPLSVIRKESPETDLSWFETLEKKKVDIGFESYSPNFYYRNSKVTVIYTAELERLRELMPDTVLKQVEPLQVWPGRGLVALTAYAYHYCDNDEYNEISLSVITQKPGHLNMGPVSLVRQAMSKDFWGYVLKLPVDTELARVRGVVGYNLPKWLTPIEYQDNTDSIVFRVLDPQTGQLEMALETQKLDELSEEPALVTNSFTNESAAGELKYGHAVSRQLRYGSSTDDESVKLQLGTGNFAQFIRSLKLGDMLRYDYVPEFQSALYAPEPLVTLLADD